MKEYIDRLREEHTLTREGFLTLLSRRDPATQEYAMEEAVKVRRQIYGKEIYIRGLVEITNYCKNNCYYCGIRGGNRNVARYRLSREEILDCCHEGYRLGFRTFVLQGGEDPFYTDELTASLVREIKQSYPDCALTLSVGEKSRESYRLFREAGADRYLLRHETANEEHYRKLHPDSMSLANRKRCLYDLKSLGYQVGAGMMIGSPGQSTQTLAEDLLFLQELQPQMVGLGPFIPHHDTCFAEEPAGSIELTLYLLSLVRILLPAVLLPSTTALGTLDPSGREKGLMAGANVVMPNLSPVKNRKQYELYNHKICTDEEAAEGLESLRKRVQAAGFTLVSERGDAWQPAGGV